MRAPTLNRRQLLRSLALAGGAIVGPSAAWVACRDEDTLPATPATVASDKRRTDHYFVFYYMMGGWDLQLLTEPLENRAGVHVPFAPEEIFETAGHRYGPSMRPVLRWLDKGAFVRGIRPTALNHPQARIQLVTGHFKDPKAPERASIQSMLAQKIGKGYALPNISSDSMRPAVFLGDLDPHVKPMRIRSPEQLEQILEVEGDTKGYQEAIQATIAKRDRAFAERTRTKLAEEFVAYADLARKVRSSDMPGRADAMGQPNFDARNHVTHGNRWGRQAHLAVELIRQDLAPIVSVGSGEFDAHNSHDYRNHRRDVTRGMETVASILEGLERVPTEEGGNLLDKTTVVVCSEFSREPGINELGGKHHWPANSMLLFGKGLKRKEGGGPMVLGACDDGLFPIPLDIATGELGGKRAELLDIVQALATVLKIGGVDPTPIFDAEPLDALIA
jgi:hypothetical protein